MAGHTDTIRKKVFLTDKSRREGYKLVQAADLQDLLDKGGTASSGICTLHVHAPAMEETATN